MLHPLIHSRQFLLGPKQELARPDWLSRRVTGGLYLSHCPKLKVASVTDKRERQWLILGVAVQVDPSKPAPTEQLRQFAGEDVACAYQSWAGRWLVLVDGAIHLDASGLLGCYYRFVPDGTEGQGLWISSSLALLINLPGVAPPRGKPRQLVAEEDLNWDPPPGTGYVGIRRLLPTQILDAASGAIRARPLDIHTAPALTYNQVLDQLASCLVTAIKRVQGKIHLALSAGYDSRMLLAAAQAAGVEFSTYTQTFPSMLSADRTLPPLLAKLVGVEHVHIHRARKEQPLLEAFDEHCGARSVAIDRAFVAHKQWSWTGPGHVLVRGGGFELGRCFYWNKLPGNRPTVDTLLRAFGVAHCPQYVQESLADCLAWFDKMPIEGLDWRDRFYLESRLAGWASANQQALDVTDGFRFAPANAARIYKLMLAVPEDKRRSGQHQIDLIERLSPDLLRYPFNQPDGLLRVTQRRVRKFSSLLKSRGLASTACQVEVAIKRRLKRRTATYHIGKRRD